MKVSFLSLCIYLLISPLWAQSTFEPDTNLTYDTFLRQCQDFSRTTESEIWVVNFWTSWNGAALDMMPQLKQVFEAYATRKPVRFISISLDKNRDQWLDRVVRFELPWEHLFLPGQEDYEFLRTAFRHRSIPALFLVDTKGDIHRMADIAALQQELDFQTATLPNEPYATLVVAPIVEPVIDPAEPVEEPNQTRATDEWITHTVRGGETLFSLYRRYSVKVDEIKRINSLSSNTIKVGDVLKIKRR